MAESSHLDFLSHHHSGSYIVTLSSPSASSSSISAKISAPERAATRFKWNCNLRRFSSFAVPHETRGFCRRNWFAHGSTGIEAHRLPILHRTRLSSAYAISVPSSSVPGVY